MSFKGEKKKNQLFWQKKFFFHQKSYVESYTGKSFRPSTSKKGEEMQFIALNCHIQNLTVSEGQPAQSMIIFLINCNF